MSGRTLLEGRTVQVTDVMSDPEYQFKEAAHVGGWRTGLGVPPHARGYSDRGAIRDER